MVAEAEKGCSKQRPVQKFKVMEDSISTQANALRDRHHSKLEKLFAGPEAVTAAASRHCNDWKAARSISTLLIKLISSLIISGVCEVSSS